MANPEEVEQVRRRRLAMAGIAVLLVVIAAGVAVPLALSGGSSRHPASSTGGAASQTRSSAAGSTNTAAAQATSPATRAPTTPGHASARPTSPTPAAPAVPAASGVAPTVRGDQLSGRKNCPPSPAMTDDPDGDCSVAQAVFTQAEKAYKQTGHIPAQVTIPGHASGAPPTQLSCVVLVPADEVTCTSQRYDAQFFLSAVGAKPPPGY